jgi:oligopeptide transport system substrate-binding protein
VRNTLYNFTEVGSVNTAALWGYEAVYNLLAEIQLRHAVIVTARRVIEKVSQTIRPSRWLIAFSLAVVTLAISACSERNEAERPREQPSQATRRPSVGGTYRRPLGNDPASIDPAKLVDSYATTVSKQIFDTLVEFDSHLNVMPALAQSWSASRDGLVWTFNLHQGVQFHNGREVSAEDIVYSLSRLLDPAVGSHRSDVLDKVQGAAEFQAGTAKNVAGIRAIDRYTIQFALSASFAPFISGLGMAETSIVPREEVQRLGASFATAPVGTGPFRFVRWDRGREIVVEANEHYFRGRPALDRVRFVFFPGNAEPDMLRAFEQGELEESPITPDRRNELLAAGSYPVIQKPTLSLRLLGFNCERPPFDQREVRQAFNYAIDKNRLNQGGQRGRSVVARSILPPGMPGYNPEVQSYSYNPDKAKQLLTQAGYPDGRDLVPVILATSRKSREEPELIQQALEAIGIQLEFQQFEDWTTYQQALQKGEVQLFTYTWTADYPDPHNFLYPLFHSQSPTNYFRYRNPTVDKLLDDARGETDDLRRVDLYRQAEQIILNDAPVVTLLHYANETVFQPYVEGVEVSALGYFYVSFRKVWLEQTWQTRNRK